MSKQVVWTKVILEEFIDQANLTHEEEMIMRTRAAGWTRTEQSLKFGISLPTLDRIIRRLKIKYDRAQEHSLILPVRKSSVDELYLDEN